MKVAVVGLLRAANAINVWKIVTHPIVVWITRLIRKLQGKPSPTTKFEDLPSWWKEVPDGKLRGAENYYK